uniref:Uncharacterized protein LOC109682442 n=1 Tax=Castor canadensis TaxID=51338 RepID=A0A8B7U6A1_CASCN|nr:uncharacterized protein LOC109682442 [Castor canadensis]
MSLGARALPRTPALCTCRVPAPALPGTPGRTVARGIAAPPRPDRGAPGEGSRTSPKAAAREAGRWRGARGGRGARGRRRGGGSGAGGGAGAGGRQESKKVRLAGGGSETASGGGRKSVPKTSGEKSQRGTAAARAKEETAEEEALRQPGASRPAPGIPAPLLRPRPPRRAPGAPSQRAPGRPAAPRRARLPWPGRTARAALPGKSKPRTSRRSSSSRRPSERKWAPGRRGWRWPRWWRRRLHTRLLLSPPPPQKSARRCVLIVGFTALPSTPPPRAHRVGLRPRVAPLLGGRGRGAQGAQRAAHAGGRLSTSPVPPPSTAFSPRVTVG